MSMRQSELQMSACSEWKEPGVVIGQDSAVVFVRHGGTCISLYYLRVRKVNIENVDQHVTRDGNGSDLEQGQEIADNNIDDTEHIVTNV